MPDSNYVKLSIHQGDDVSFPVTMETVVGSPIGPIDLFGSTIESQIRLSWDSPDIIASFTINETNLSLGQFALELDNATTAALPVVGRNATFVFDVEITYATLEKNKIMYGELVVQREVTR